MQWPSLTTIWCGIFIAYISHSIWTVRLLFIAPACEDGEHCIQSFLSSNPRLQFIVFLSTGSSSVPSDAEPVWQENIVQYEEQASWSKSIPVSEHVKKNGSLYLHVFVMPKQLKSVRYGEIRTDHATRLRVRLTNMLVPTAATYNLLGDEENSSNDPLSTRKDGTDRKALKQNKANHMKQKVTVNMLAEKTALSTKIPPEMLNLIVLAPGRQYLPTLQYNYLATRIRDYEEIKPSTRSVNVTLFYSPSSFGKMRFLLHLEASFHTLKTFGFTEKDLDELKGIFEDTNIYLLCGTVFISSIHLLFDFLALKNDVSFWRMRSNLAGLSARALFWRAFSQVIIFFYLLEEKTSLLVIGPAGIGVLIEFWKLSKVIKFSFTKTSWGLPWISISVHGKSKTEELTRKLDAEAMQYLSYVLYPLCIGGAFYSLMYQPHRSWYSWAINSLVNGVYAFGFLFMLPQLFINYRLKSVAHLPLRALMYKAFNTFIDDAFAFIITMPTAHRFACFRDDIVFIVYMYQRWLYPVDKTRLDEGAGEPEEELLPESGPLAQRDMKIVAGPPDVADRVIPKDASDSDGAVGSSPEKASVSEKKNQ